MSRLLIDVGNTRIKWALQTSQGLLALEAVTQASLSDAQLQQRLQHHAVLAQRDITDVLVANVAGEQWRARLTAAVQHSYQLSPRFLVSTAEVQVAGQWLRNAYAEPHKLGVDRWLAMQAARSRAPNQALLVVSAGTALTIDAVTATGTHLGGLIVPGAALMVRSLMQGTSDIAAHADHQSLVVDRWFGDNTFSGVTRGAQHALTALVMAAHAQLAAGDVPHLFMTGGDAAALQLPPDLQTRATLVNDLVLEGLSLQA